MRKVKILHLTHSFFPVYGGTSSRNYNLMKDDNYRYSVYAPQAPCSYIPPDLGHLKDREMKDNIEIQRIPITPDISDRNPLIYRLPYYIKYIVDVHARARKLYKAVNENGIDIVYGHSPLEFGLASHWYARDKCVPLIYEAHSFLTDSLHADLLHNLKNKRLLTQSYHRLLFQFINRYEVEILRNADCIIAQTETIKKKMVGLFNISQEKILLIMNGVDFNIFDPGLYKDHNHLLFNSPRDKAFIILYSGFLNSINGIDFLISAFQDIIKKSDIKLKLIIAGRGPLQQYVENISKVNPSIQYIGLIRYEDMPILYNACDLFVIPRPAVKDAEEFYPIKLIEAMAMEKTGSGE